jgi:diguanylate cyclase (GGDEF)-like protein
VGYPLAGALLALGAPLGCFLWRWLTSQNQDFFVSELQSYQFFYLYMTFGTSGAFALFGYVLGKKGDVLETQRTTSERRAITDGLTDLYNHRYLQEHLSAEIERSQRYHSPFTCLMLDIDNFKHVNDTFGHPFGDEVLRVIARILKEQVRRVDIVGRYGGEEFLILMPQTTSQEVIPVADRIRHEIQEYPFRREGANLQVTLSVGMATFDPNSATPPTRSGLLKAADEALYQAKRSGKNRTQVSG